MHHVVFVAEFCDRRSGGFCFGEYFVDPALLVGIEHKELASVRARMAKKFQTIGFRARKRLLMSKNDAGGIILKFAGADEAAARAAFTAAGYSVFLRVWVERIAGILRHDLIANPILER